MPFKDQTQSYRTIKGERWACLADVVDGALKGHLEALASAGIRVRRVSFKDEGVVRLFVPEASLQAACDAVNQRGLFQWTH